jgi:preprotein translocase subunit SecG
MKVFLQYFYYLLCLSQFLIGAFLIFIVTMQESKTDGLQGQIGSTSTSSFRGKAGREEMLNLWTRNAAIIFFVISILVAVGTKRWG